MKKVIIALSLVFMVVSCFIVTAQEPQQIKNNRLQTIEYDGYKWIAIIDNGKIVNLIPHPDCPKHFERDVAIKKGVLRENFNKDPGFKLRNSAEFNRLKFSSSGPY